VEQETGSRLHFELFRKDQVRKLQLFDEHQKPRKI